MSERAGDRSRLSGQRGANLQARAVLAAAVIVIAGFMAFGALTLWAGLLGIAVIFAAAIIGLVPSPHQAAPDRAQRLTGVTPGDPMLAAVISGIPDPVAVLNREGRVLAFNAQMHTLAPALRPGEPASIALRTPDLVEAIREASASGAIRRAEFSLRLPADRWYEAFVTPVERDFGVGKDPLSLLLVTLHDLTPLRQVEEMRADFVANASHELRTPLAALSGFIETLQGAAREDIEAQRRFLPIMHAQASRMARLIDDLLSLSRIERNEHRHPETVVDVVPLVRQVVDGLESLAREREVTVSINEPSQPLKILGDRDELIRVYENLVENALKYGANGKRVDVAIGSGVTADGTPELRVAVKDYGAGIAPEHLPRLTERFYRVDVADSRAQGGTGLGLALVKHILNRHRGRLSIVSSRGAGATFTTHIPISPGVTDSDDNSLVKS